VRSTASRRRAVHGAASARTRSGAAPTEFDSDDSNVDGAFDDGAFSVDRDRRATDERSGEPLRVCLSCGEEDPSEAVAAGPCAHAEVAVFSEAPSEAIAAADRVRRAMAELGKAQRALSGLARSAVTSGEAVIDERPRLEPEPVAAPTIDCAACAERAALEATEPSKSKRGKRAKGTSAPTAEQAQGSFAFVAPKPA